MWAQLVKFRVAQDKVGALRALDGEWAEKVGRAPGSGWVKTVALQGASDPTEQYVLVMFESEAAARASEQTPNHLAFLEKVMATVAGPPEFWDLTVVNEMSR
jgi:quinol monooxygenase YgiN